MPLHRELKAIDDEERAARAASSSAGDSPAAQRHGLQDREELIDFLEEIAGRTFYTREDLDRFLTELRAESEKARQSSRVGRQGVWLLALVFAFLQYQIIDIITEVSSLRSSSVLPVKTGFRS